MFIPDNQKLRLILDATQLLYSNSIGGIVVCIVASSALVFAFPNSQIFDVKLLWWVVINTLMSLRLLDTLWWHRCHDKSDSYNPKIWFTKFRIGALITACLWGVFGALTIHQMADVEFVATVIILAALAGAAPTLLSADRFLALVYSAMLIMPISVMGILDEQYMRQVLGGLGILFSANMIFSALKTTHFMREAINIKHHNKDLLEQTSCDKQKLAEQNLRLESSYLEIINIKKGLEQQVRLRTEELLILSQHDDLTGLLNRKTFIAKLSQRLDECENQFSYIALIFVDINQFKKINDSQGHATGDKILVKVAKVLQKLPEECNASRWGGDEFVLFLDMDGNQQALHYGELINAAIKEATSGYGLDVSAAIGVSFCNRHSGNADELVKLADIAMLEHKKAPKNLPAVVFEARFLTKLERYEALRYGLTKAIEKQQFSLVYQPIYNLNKGTVSSYEVLLRWQFSEEHIEPEEFIPIAENSHVIGEIGLWVLENACTTMLASRLEPDVSLAVNISIQQIKQPQFAQHVSEILKHTGFPGNRLHLEITESVFCDNPGMLLSSISQLRHFGVSFGLDDFGTGYSSMVQLQALPFSCIKIDKRFVYDIDGAGGAIIRSVILLADELGMSVIVEGIETQKQLDRVHGMGINLVQGYFCSKPRKQMDPDFKPPMVFENFEALH